MILKDKTIIVTGVGPGMNSKLAILAAREGARVVMAARSEGLVHSLEKDIRASGGQALAVQADVSKLEDCKRVAAEAVRAFGRIDGLANSAYRGQYKWAPIEEADFDDWRKSFDVTLFGALNMVKAVLPSMKANGGGVIVNVNSGETRRPLVQNGSYSVPKAALLGATRLLALELAPYKIRVNSAVIGWMWGKTLEDYFTSLAKESGVPLEKLLAERSATIPVGHIPPDDQCAKTVLMLLSDYTSEVTGAAYDVNGGEHFSL